MTRDRIYGQDKDFCDWLRKNQNLPSTEIVISDVDCIVHQYKTIVDSIGTRDIQSILYLEVKTRGASLTKSQLDTLFKLHKTMFTSRLEEINGQFVRNWGVAIVSMDGTHPFNSKCMYWGRFDEYGGLDWGDDRLGGRVLTVETLNKLLRFEIHPDNFQPEPFRRHHKNLQIEKNEFFPLG